MLLVKTLFTASNAQAALAMLVTVSVYVPRLPLVLNVAMPAAFVVAVCFTFVPLGLVQKAETTAPATDAPLASATVTSPITLTFFPCSVADKVIAVLRSIVVVTGLTTIWTVSLAVALVLSVTVSVAVKVPALD